MDGTSDWSVEALIKRKTEEYGEISRGPDKEKKGFLGMAKHLYICFFTCLPLCHSVRLGLRNLSI